MFLLVEAFRESVTLLNLAYLVVIIILAFVYISVEPFLLYSVRRKFENYLPTASNKEPEKASEPEKNIVSTEQMTAAVLNSLTKREREQA